VLFRSDHSRSRISQDQGANLEARHRRHMQETCLASQVLQRAVVRLVALSH